MNNIFLQKPSARIETWIKAHTSPDLSIPLCFKAVDAGAVIALKCNGNSLKNVVFQTSSDRNVWTDYTYADNITLANAGDKIYFKVKTDSTSIARTASSYLQFTTTQNTKLVNVSGNIMSLLAPEFKELKNTNAYDFYRLFLNCKNIQDCSHLNLPAARGADNCYKGMFYSCSSLTIAPKLPAVTLADSCYDSMFSFCTSLIQAPELLAVVLANRCYASMFQNCNKFSVCHMKSSMQSIYNLSVHGDTMKTVIYDL